MSSSVVLCVSPLAGAVSSASQSDRATPTRLQSVAARPAGREEQLVGEGGEKIDIELQMFAKKRSDNRCKETII